MERSTTCRLLDPRLEDLSIHLQFPGGFSIYTAGHIILTPANQLLASGKINIDHRPNPGLKPWTSQLRIDTLPTELFQSPL